MRPHETDQEVGDLEIDAVQFLEYDSITETHCASIRHFELSIIAYCKPM
jgi:hypothetical protein